MRESYLVVPDLHFNSHKQNRFDYYGECLDVIEKLHDINKKINADKKYLISLDDMVDRGKSISDLYDKVIQLIKYLLSPFDGTFIALGNHSRTYHIDNPIFSFIRNFESDTLRGWKGKPKSLTQDIVVCDRLVFDDVEFVFRHYGTGTDKVSNKMGILFMHDDLYPPEAKDLVTYIKHPYAHPISNFDFVFNAHLHTIRCVWSIGSTQIHNLGSLLRTKSCEVNDFDLNRAIPIIYINDNKFETIEIANLTLPPREMVYKEEAYQEQKQTREFFKEKSMFKEYGKLFLLDKDPLRRIDDAVQSSHNFRVRVLWNKIKGEL